MAPAIVLRSIPLFAASLLWAALASSAWAISLFLTPDLDAELGLVRVNIITETRGPEDVVEINGQRIKDYSPVIIQVFSSTGIVLDGKGHIMTFLGYHWAAISDREPRIEVLATGGQKLKGRLIGIDESNGVAVIRLSAANLRKTPLCLDCELKDGATVVAPVWGRTGPSQYHESQILSVGTTRGLSARGGWTMKVSRPFPDTGLPLLTADRRILGFVASQDPVGIRAVVYPISRLLESAEKIIGKGGHIRAGWLGVFIADSSLEQNTGVVVQGIEPESPAQRAGLEPNDFLIRFNGRPVADSRHFIQLVQDSAIGSQAALDIIRAGKPLTLRAVIEARRNQPFRGRLAFHLQDALNSSLDAARTGTRRLGPQPLVGLDTIVLNAALADAMQLPRQSGLLVIDVAKQMPADLAGVLVGDIIVAMDGQPVTDASSFASCLEKRDWGSRLELKLVRKGVERTITVHLPDRGR